MGDPARQLLDDLRNHKPDAYDALIRMGGPAIPALLAALQDEKSDQLREAIVWIIGEIGDIRPAQRLLELLRYDPCPLVRLASVWALGQVGDVRAVPELLNVLRNDEYEDARSMAAEGLGELGDTSAVPGLA